MNIKTMLAAGLFAGTMAFSSVAQAVPVIDFTTSNPIWIGSSSVTNIVAGVSVTVTSSIGGVEGGILNADAISDGLVTPCNGFGPGLECGVDGIGINSNDPASNDEVSNVASGEKLTVSFTSSVNIIAVGFLDLFAPTAEATETVSFQINGGGTVFALDGTTTVNGFAETALNLVGVDFIDFFVASGSNTNSDFALAYLELAPGGTIGEVPLPPASILFGSALLGMGWLARRRKVKAAA